MACHLIGAKPLSEPMPDYCQLDPWEHISMKINQNTAIFIEENAHENVVYEMASILSRPQCVNRYISIKHCTEHLPKASGSLLW